MYRLYLAIGFLSCFGLRHAAQSQYALDFNGGTDHVVLNGTDFSPPWTMEVKICKNETDNYQHLLTSTDGNSGIRNEQWWGTRVGFTQSGVADYTFNYTLPVGQWVHMAMVNSGIQTRLYINGIDRGTISNSIDFPMKWISKPNEEASLKARIDELRIWQTALDQTIIQAWMDQGLDPSHPNWNDLRHYYTFDEGSGTVCHDSKGGLDGTIHGAAWYIETNHDAGIISLLEPKRNPDNYGPDQPLVIRVKNYGLEKIQEDFDISYILNGAVPVTVTVDAGTDPLLSNETIDIIFPSVNMDSSGTYQYLFFTSLPGDENHGNDTLAMALVCNSTILGDVTGLETDTTSFRFYAGADQVKVIFYTEDIFRIWLGPGGVFSNPTGSMIWSNEGFHGFQVGQSDEGTYYKLATPKLVLRVYKSPLTFAMYRPDNETLIWEEEHPIDFGTRSFQYLSRGTEENFYGCGMQNGYFSHRNTRVTIGLKISNWDDGAVPNPAPFYMSTAGYGAFRNTFKPGEYDFRDQMSFAHEEERFDCFYFYGPTLKEVLDGYTRLTGRPFLPPRWGLSLGDADCYNKEGQTTPDVITLVADKYREHDLPGGWILPNDGYGCGYVKLDSVAGELAERGFRTGLWTENGLANLPWEVGTAGVRAYKLDVAWVGSGYQQALNACRQAFTGIETHADARGFVWSVCGWAGTQRYSTIWSGDQSGNWEYIRFHIPTIIGAGLSGFNCASSDLDGIFGGSAKTYVRDLQWKTFIPVFYAMSGWATRNRQPWVYGPAYTAINRSWLKLKMRLTPYMYTYCHQAAETGIPAVRAMVLEFPDDPVTEGTATRYQFMSGEWFLVAPVYQDLAVRDSIYLPGGRWIDYWTGDSYSGPQFLNGYPVPIDTIPVFIRSGAIIPMIPEMLYDGQKPFDTLILEIFPDGETRFDLYEDDGATLAYRTGAFSITPISCSSPAYGIQDDIKITIGSAEGDYEGKPAGRAYWIEVHYPGRPDAVLLNHVGLDTAGSLTSLKAKDRGYYYDTEYKKGILFIKTPSLSVSSEQVIEIKMLEGMGENIAEPSLRIYPNPASGQVRVEFTGTTPWHLQVFDTNGRSVSKTYRIPQNQRSATIPVSCYRPGAYLIRVNGSNRQYTARLTIANE